MKLPISVIILTYNEGKNIRDCLLSICDWADEIFVVDSGSIDKTLEIAKEFTDKIYQHNFDNFAQQRNWAQDYLPIKNEWVLHLDADERISTQLSLRLNEIFSSVVQADGFIVPRKTIFRKRWIRYGGHYPVYHLRIFKKNKGRCEERLYDQHYVVNGKIEKVEGDMINIITSNLKSWRLRHKKWAALEAEEVLLNKNRFSCTECKGTPIAQRKRLRYNYYRMPLFIRPFIYFVYRYILKLGFLDGWQGLVFHFWQGLWYRLFVDIKIVELRNKIKCIS